ncbi:MAG: hypothetical protein DHS20C01_17440 [marine bacterium B5-7]|nr:MAG: hypothetical protein DHS20C01_17440 [marine bacterium B5-7]
MVFGLVLMIAAGLLFLTTDTARDLLADYLSSISGQVVRIDGDLDFDFSEWSLKTRDVSVATDDSEPFVELERIELRDLKAVLNTAGGPPVKIKVEHVDVHMDRLPSGGGTPSKSLAELLPPFGFALEVVNLNAYGREREKPLIIIDGTTLDFDTPHNLAFAVRGEFRDNPLTSRLTLEMPDDSAVAGKAAGNPDENTDSKASAGHHPHLSGWIDYSGLTLLVDGEIADVMSARGINLHFTAGGDIGQQAIGSSAAFIDEHVSGRLSGDVGNLTFDIEQFDATTRYGSISLAAKVNTVDRVMLVESGKFSVVANNIQAFLGDFEIPLGYRGPGTAAAAFRGDLDDMMISDIDINVGNGQLIARADVGVTGTKDARVVSITDGKVTLDIEDSASLLTLTDYWLPLNGTLKGGASVKGSLGNLVINDFIVNLNDGELRTDGAFDVGLTPEQPPEITLRDVNVSINTSDIGPLIKQVDAKGGWFIKHDRSVTEQWVEFIGPPVDRTAGDSPDSAASEVVADNKVHLPTKGALKASAKLNGTFRKIAIQKLKADYHDGLLSGEGAVDIVLTDSKPEVILKDTALRLNAKDFAQAARIIGLNIPSEGNINANAVVSGPIENIQISTLKADLGEGAVIIDANGTAGFGRGAETDDARAMLNLVTTATFDRADRVFKTMPMPTWFGGTGLVSGTLVHADHLTSLNQLDAGFTGSAGKTRITGDIKNLENFAFSGLIIEFDAAPGSGTEASSNGLVDASEEPDKSSGNTTIQKLHVTVELPDGLDGVGQFSGSAVTDLGHVQTKGTVAAPREFGKIDASFEFEPVERRSPDNEVAGSTSLKTFTGTIKMDSLVSRRLEINAKTADGTGRIHYSGAVDPAGGDGTLLIEHLDLNILAAIAGVDSTFANHIDLDAGIVYDKSSLEFKDVLLKAGDSDVSGRILVDLPGENKPLPVVHADVQSRMLKFSDFIVEESKSEASGDESDKASRIFSTTPVNVEFLNKIDLDLKAGINEFHFGDLPLEKIQIKVDGSNGVVNVLSHQILFEGDSTLDLKVDVRSEKPRVDIDFKASAVNPGRFVKSGNNDHQYSGDVDIDIALKGVGNSQNAIVSSGTGYLILTVNKALLPDSKLDLLSASIVMEVLRLVNPFKKQQQGMKIECGLIAWKIGNGFAVADKTIVIKGDRLFLLGEGKINLSDESLEMVFIPKAQEGLGFNTSGLMKFIGVGGTLSKPVIRPDAKGLLKSGASIGAAWLSGGMSLLLQNMFDRVTAGSRECERVEGLFRDHLAGVQSSPEQSTGTQAPSKQQTR